MPSYVASIELNFHYIETTRLGVGTNFFEIKLNFHMSLAAGLGGKVLIFVKKKKRTHIQINVCKQKHNTTTSGCLPWMRQANRPTCCLKEE